MRRPWRENEAKCLLTSLNIEKQGKNYLVNNTPLINNLNQIKNIGIFDYPNCFYFGDCESIYRINLGD
jgi:hypothetical protein